MIWYIWAGPGSPVFGKAKMATFERYFLEDKETHIEEKNSYYKLLENEEVIGSILEEFGLDKADAHIVNGHVPVEQIHGESPIKCGGKLLIIDGGFSKWPIRKRRESPDIPWYAIPGNASGGP